MKIMILIVAVVTVLTRQAYCQDAQQSIGGFTKFYTAGKAMDNSLIGGFSLGGLIGAFLFGAIGFIAFVYGKRMNKFKPIMIGILLIAYPYFIRNIIVLYLVGIILTIGLFVFRR